MLYSFINIIVVLETSFDEPRKNWTVLYWDVLLVSFLLLAVSLRPPMSHGTQHQQCFTDCTVSVGRERRSQQQHIACLLRTLQRDLCSVDRVQHRQPPEARTWTDATVEYRRCGQFFRGVCCRSTNRKHGVRCSAANIYLSDRE